MNYSRSFPLGLEGKYAKVFSRIPVNSSVLELGCNEGYFSEYLAKKGHNVLGCDNDSDAVSRAIKKGVSAKFIDLESSIYDGLEGCKFDTILCMDVLEHLRNPPLAVQKLRAMLNEGGSIIATGPNVAYWAIRLMLLQGEWNYQEAGIMDSTHLRFFARSNWINLFKSSGFSRVICEPAEIMIPLESRLSGLPLILKPLKKYSQAIMPDLFTTVFIIQAWL